MNVTEAQTTTINQVGILSPWDADGEKDVWDAFKDGLTELGYPEGKGVTFVSRFGKVQTLHGNIPGDFYYMAPSVPRRSEMPRFKTWSSDPDPLVNAIKEVKNKNIFVTLVDRAPSNNDNSVRDLYVAGNNPALGATAGEYIKKNTPNAQVAVIRGLPIPIDQQRQDGFDKAIAGSNVKVLEKQFGNWNRDDAFKVMQDFLTKYPKIDVVWCQDDDMAVGVLQAIDQAKRTDIQYVIAGAGSKDMVKKVMDGDKLIPVDVLYPPAMVATAMELTAANFYNQVPVRGSYIIDATLITRDNAKGFYFPDSPF